MILAAAIVVGVAVGAWVGVILYVMQIEFELPDLPVAVR